METKKTSKNSCVSIEKRIKDGWGQPSRMALHAPFPSLSSEDNADERHTNLCHPINFSQHPSYSFSVFSPPPCFCVRCRYSHPIIFFEWVQKTKKKTSEVGQPFFTQRKKKKRWLQISSLITCQLHLPYLDLMV